MAGVDSLAGGMDTARLSASQRDRLRRQERDAAALKFLTDRDLGDVAEILGLVPAGSAAGRLSLAPHGNVDTYRYRHCRCEPCRAAWAARSRSRDERRQRKAGAK
ncbi:hypothetical protein [Micromonospora zhanjiangensis]|uniref:Uncharacterized protein n=1 Tax=Micromonospora zhanjiangensis TaxID=1522057 RepID=A0ABV8KNW2_9ACTN